MRAQLQTRKLDLKEGCKRKLMFNGPGSNSKPTRIPELKRAISNSSNSSSTKKTEINKNQQPVRNGVKRNKSLPSRLRKSSKISSKVVPMEATEECGEIGREQKTPKKLIMTRKSRTFLEDDFALMNDFSIEKAVGLCWVSQTGPNRYTPALASVRNCIMINVARPFLLVFIYLLLLLFCQPYSV